MNTNWVSILIFVLAFGGPALSWIVTQLKEKAGEKRQQTLRQRLREEELRTGRRSSDGDLPTLQSKEQSKEQARASELQRLAERRQQQLRELRQRQAQQQQERVAKSATAASGAAAGQRNLPSAAQTKADQARQRMQERLQQRQAELRQRQEALQQRRQQSQQATRSASAQQQRSSDRLPGPSEAASIQAALRRSAQAASLDQASIQTQLREAPSSAATPTLKRVSKATSQQRVGAEVRELLRGSPNGTIRRPSLSALLAVSEVLAKPVSMRDSEGEGGVTL